MVLCSVWKSLVQASLDRNKSISPSHRYVQLATVRTNGRPANRTVVFRGFVGDNAQLSFVTDARSEKVDQINQSPYAEVCWYFPVTREQYRFSGTLHVIMYSSCIQDDQKMRQAAWENLSDQAREQFLWPNPGEVRTGPSGQTLGPVPGSEEPAPKTFCLVTLDATEVDYLQLKQNKRTRFTKSCDNSQEWLEADINP